MRACTFTTLVAALGLSAAGGATALADEYRGPLESIDTARHAIRVMGVTVRANGFPLDSLDLNSSYVVTWQKQGGENVLTNIQPDTSDSSRHK